MKTASSNLHAALGEDALVALKRYGFISSKMFTQAMAKHAHNAYHYAWWHLEGKRFPEGEPTIAASPTFALHYAHDVLRTKWPEPLKALAEKSIRRLGPRKQQEYAALPEPPATPVHASKKTASTTLGYRTAASTDTLMALDRYGFVSKAIKDALATDAEAAKRYSLVIKAPFPAADAAFAAKPYEGLEYARIWRTRMPLLEAAIIAQGDPMLAYNYAVTAIAHGAAAEERRWVAAEPLIAYNLESGFRYAWVILHNGRFPAVEPLVARFPGSQYGQLYIKNILHGDTSLLPAPSEKQASAKTASSQLDRSIQRENTMGRVISALLTENLLTKAVKAAVFAKPTLAFEVPWRTGRRWVEAEPAIFSIGGANSGLPMEYINAFMGGKDAPDLPAYAEHYLEAELGVCHECGTRLEGPDYEVKDAYGWKYCSEECRDNAQAERDGAVDDPDDYAPHREASAKTSSSQIMMPYRDFAVVFGSLGRMGMGRGIRDFLASLAPSDLLRTIQKLGYRYPHLRLPWPEVEAVFLKDANYAALYALQCIAGPWPAAEALIATDGLASCRYAQGALQARFLPGELAIAKLILSPDDIASYPGLHYYSEMILGKRDSTATHEAEAAAKAWAQQTLTGEIAKTASSQFPRFVNWLSLVAPLDRNGMLSKRLRYALAHIPGRGAEMGYRVAVLMGRRFPEAEPAIAADAGWAVSYVTKFFPGYSRWPEAEPAIARAMLEGIAHPGTISYSVLDYVMDRIREAGEVAGNATIKGWAERVLAGKSSSLKIASARLNPALGTYQLLLDLQRTKLDRGVRTQMAALTPDQLWPIAKRLGLIGSGNGFPWPEVEAVFAQDPEQAFRYVNTVLYQPCPVLEPAIASNPKTAYSYATMILHGRFPAGEPAISFPLLKGRGMGKGCYAAMCYFRDYVLGDRQAVAGAELDAQATAWAESVAARAKQASRKTASNQLTINMGQRGGVLATLARHNLMSKAVTQAMKGNPRTAVLYAADVVQQRCPELEPIILTDAVSARLYAWAVLKGKRWKEAEPIIARDPRAAGLYATGIMKKPWPEAEPAIARGDWVSDYCDRCLKIKDVVKVMDWVHAMRKVPIPPLPGAKTAAATVHRSLISPNLLTALQRYNMLSKPMLAAITESSHFALIYANYVLETRFPAGEPAIARGNGISLYGKYTLAKSNDNEAKLAFARMATKLNSYDLVSLLKDMKATDPTEDLRERCLATLTGGLCFCLLYHEQLPKELEWSINNQDRDVNEQAALEYIQHVLQAPWPAFERYLSRVHARNTVHAGIFARNYLSLDCIKQAHRAGATFAPEFTQAFLTDPYTETWSTYAAEYESAPMTGREIQDTHVFASRLAANSYSSKPEMDPWVFSAYVFGSDRDYEARKKIAAYLKVNHPECVDTTGEKGFMHVEWVPTKAMSRAAAKVQGLTMEDFVKVYGERRIDDYQMAGFFGEHPVQGSLKTASTQLDFADTLCLGNVIGILLKNGMLTTQLKQAFLSTCDPADAINAVRAYCRPWPEAEPILAQDPSIAADYATETLKGRFPLAEQEWHKVAPLWWKEPTDVPFALTRYYDRLVRTDPPHADSYFKGAWRWLQGEGKQASSKTASSKLTSQAVFGDAPYHKRVQVACALQSIGVLSKFRRYLDPVFARTALGAYLYAEEVLRHKWDGPLAQAAERLIDWHGMPGEQQAYAALPEGKPAAHQSSRTASAQLDLKLIMPDPYDYNFNGYIRWMEALHRTGLQTKAIYQAHLSNPWMALSYAATCQNRKPSPDILAAIQQHEGALEWYEDWEFDRQVDPNPEIDDAGLGGDDPHLAGLKIASSQLPDGIFRDSTTFYRSVLTVLNRSGFMSKRILAAVAAKPGMACAYAHNILHSRWPAAEPVIATDPKAAYFYAYQCVGGEWPEAEPTLFTDPFYAAMYAIYLLHRRWPAAEPVICRGSRAQDYASMLMGYRYPSKQDEWISWMKSRPTAFAPPPPPEPKRKRKRASSQLPWPQADGLVFNHLIDALQRNGMLSKRILGAMAATPKAAWRYADIFLRRRWPEAEPAIAQDPKIAMWYATDVIQGPWPEAEPAIARGDWAEMYARQVLHLPYPQIRKWREMQAKTPVFAPPPPARRTRKPRVSSSSAA